MQIFVMALEPIESRYTIQWFDGLPNCIKQALKDKNINGSVYNVVGRFQNTMETTKGAFLNFTKTNVWKNDQMNILAQNFERGLITPGDKILFPDAWHPGIIQTKYMSELLDIPVEIHAIWHAGSYDPQDFLGRKIKDKRWSKTFERSLAHCIDYNYFATHYHIELFEKNILFGCTPFEDEEAPFSNQLVRSGQPHDALIDTLKPYSTTRKENIILFPHRIAPEKQPEIFDDLAKSMPEYEWIKCQDLNLSKDEYHKLLGRAKLVFSANLQETLGISAMEAVITKTIPFVPDRLSYSEMYLVDFLYPSDYTITMDRYKENKNNIISLIRHKMNNYQNYSDSLSKQEKMLETYLKADEMTQRLIS